MAENGVVTIIDEALETFADEEVVSKNRAVDVFLDARLASDDPAVVAEVDRALSTLRTPNLISWPEMRDALLVIRATAAVSPERVPV